MSFKIIETTVSAAVAANGTIVFNYPAGFDAGSFYKATGHKLNVRGLQTIFSSPVEITVALGATSATVTYKGATTIPAGSVCQLQLEMQGQNDLPVALNPAVVKRSVEAVPVLVLLGAPAALSTTAVAAAQARGAAGDMTINGASAANGVATFDVPRGVQIVSAGAGDTTQTATVYGTDEYGNALRENINFNGVTPVLGKKAFKTVTRIAVSAATAGNISAGNTDVLGLPVFLAEAALILKELQDGAAAAAGTTVAGDPLAATATTGDVRGTYDPSAACNGAIVFQLVVAVPDPSNLGNAQFNG